jgi:regulator of sirC expression with transglutaminase-like and TPR domain
MSVHYLLDRAEFELRQPQPDTAAIIRDFDQIIQLDPNEVSHHLDFANALLRLGHRQQAIEQFQAAIRYNDLLDPNEPKRLTPSQVQAIEEQMRG